MEIYGLAIGSDSVDPFIERTRGKSKNSTLCSPHLSDLYPAFPVFEMPSSPKKSRVQDSFSLPSSSPAHVSFRSTLHLNEAASPTLKGRLIARNCSLILHSASDAIRRSSWERTRPIPYHIGWRTSRSVSPSPTAPSPTALSPPAPYPSPTAPYPTTAALRAALLTGRLRDAGVSRQLRFASLCLS